MAIAIAAVVSDKRSASKIGLAWGCILDLFARLKAQDVKQYFKLQLWPGDGEDGSVRILYLFIILLASHFRNLVLIVEKRISSRLSTSRARDGTDRVSFAGYLRAVI